MPSNPPLALARCQAGFPLHQTRNRQGDSRPHLGFEFIPQPIVPPVTTIGGLLRFWKSWRETKDQVRQILRETKPAAVLGLGGYAAGVAVKMAASRKIPTAILNPDVIPGKANQFLMKHTSAVCCQFEQTAEHVPAEFRSNLHITGCPHPR